MVKKQLRDLTFNYLGTFGNEIRTKLDNICGKTGRYNVPTELFQKRTNRKNRVLISWKTVKENKMTIQQLKTFSGGVVVEFINNDYFDEINQTVPLFNELKKRLGSDEIVASMISIRTEDGSSSSSIPRQSYLKLLKQFPDYQSNKIKRKKNVEYSGIGNDKWEGYVYISIRGGQQDTIATHSENVDYQLFNPACEFASEDICLDIDLVLSYFALKSIKDDNCNDEQRKELQFITDEVANCLQTCEYENNSFTGNLLNYCEDHPSLKIKKNFLFDPIQVEEIYIHDFSIVKKDDERNLDLTHDESVKKNKYYWDVKHNCILSPARPSNVFWSKHLSNMMQQNFSLKEYFKHEEDIVTRRKNLLDEK